MRATLALNGLKRLLRIMLVYSFIHSHKKQQSGNVGRKTPISSNLRKYVEKHRNGP